MEPVDKWVMVAGSLISYGVSHSLYGVAYFTMISAKVFAIMLIILELWLFCFKALASGKYGKGLGTAGFVRLDEPFQVETLQGRLESFKQ